MECSHGRLERECDICALTAELAAERAAREKAEAFGDAVLYQGNNAVKELDEWKTRALRAEALAEERRVVLADLARDGCKGIAGNTNCFEQLKLGNVTRPCYACRARASLTSDGGEFAKEVEAMRERIKRLEEAVIWLSGSDDFAVGGKDGAGFKKIVAPLLSSIRLDVTERST